MERIRNSKYGVAEYITGFFVLVLVTVFPLFVHEKYFDILTAKYMFFYISVIAMTVLVSISLIITRISKKTKLDILVPVRLIGPDYAILCFWGISLLSTVFSSYFYESFWGNEGRYCGFFLLSIFTAMYFVVSRKWVFSRLYIEAFLLASMLVCLWGITDFFQLDIFEFRIDLGPGDKPNFTSSFGNINTYTAYVSLVIGIAGTMFLSEPRGKRLAWYTLCIIISFFAIIVGWSDNAYLALGALFGFIPFYAFRTRLGAKRYLMMVAVFATVVQCITWICTAFKGKIVEASSLFNVLSDFPGLIFIVLLIWFITLGVYWLDRKNDESNWKLIRPYFYKVWIGVIAAVVAVVLMLLYDANTSADPHKYGSLSKYLVFNDEWGTHRLYNWRLGIENYKRFSPVHKLLGYGPETYGIVTVLNNFDEMVRAFNEKYDNAHNEYLQYFITIGPLGLLSYLGILITSGMYMIKKAVNNPCVIAFLFAVICYGVQASVNIATPMSTSFVWLFLAMGIAACSEELTKDGNT